MAHLSSYILYIFEACFFSVACVLCRYFVLCMACFMIYFNSLLCLCYCMKRHYSCSHSDSRQRRLLHLWYVDRHNTVKHIFITSVEQSIMKCFDFFFPLFSVLTLLAGFIEMLWVDFTNFRKRVCLHFGDSPKIESLHLLFIFASMGRARNIEDTKQYWFCFVGLVEMLECDNGDDLLTTLEATRCAKLELCWFFSEFGWSTWAEQIELISWVYIILILEGLWVHHSKLFP